MNNKSSFRKKPNPHLETKDNHERWLLTYADMITLLLGLFIILYSISTVDKKKLENVADAIRIGFGFGDRFRIAIFESGSEKLEDELFQPRSQIYRLWERFGYHLKKWKQSTLLKLGLTQTEELKIILYVPTTEEEDWVLDPIQEDVYQNLRNLTKDLDVEIQLRLEVPHSSRPRPENWESSVKKTAKLAWLLHSQYNIPQEQISILAHTDFRLEPGKKPENPEDLARQERVEITIRKKNSKWE